jgi:hypothetical protein
VAVLDQTQAPATGTETLHQQAHHKEIEVVRLTPAATAMVAAAVEREM